MGRGHGRRGSAAWAPQVGCYQPLSAPSSEAQPHRHPSAIRLSLSVLRFCHGNAGENGVASRSWTSAYRKSPLTRMKRLARKADRSVQTFLRFAAVVAALVAVVVYWNFGTFSPCGVLREAIRQRDDLVAVFPDGVIDFAFEAQFGEMSAKRCLAVLVETVTSPVPTTGNRPNCRCNRSRPRQENKGRRRAFLGQLHSPFERRRHRSHGRGKCNRF